MLFYCTMYRFFSGSSTAGTTTGSGLDDFADFTGFSSGPTPSVPPPSVVPLSSQPVAPAGIQFADFGSFSEPPKQQQVHNYWWALFRINFTNLILND